jgi:hypothetical protein
MRQVSRAVHHIVRPSAAALQLLHLSLAELKLHAQGQHFSLQLLPV